MPHIILEHSSNVVTKPDTALLQTIHAALAATGLVALDNLKSRIIEHSLYHVARGENDCAFVHVELAILSGRTSVERTLLSSTVLACLTHALGISTTKQKISITVEVRELDSSSYSKFTTIQ